MKRLCVAVAIALSTVAFHAGSVLAQTYPSKPIRLVVPFAAGGAVDVLARLLASKLTESIGQTLVVENRPGAGGNIAADAVAKAPPDGYTILQNTNGQAISPALYRNLPFDAVKDFAPVTQLVASNLILVASPKTEIASLAQLIALGKAKPGSLSYGSSGVGNPLHLTMEMLKRAAGIDVVAVPYRGDAQINAALIAGEVQIAVVPAATPRDIVAFIQRETAKALAAPDMRERLKAMAYEGVASTPEEFDAYFKTELAKFARIVKEAHIPAQD